MNLKRQVALWSASLPAVLGLVVALAVNQTAVAADLLHSSGGAAAQAAGGVAAGPVSTTAQATAIAQQAQSSMARATLALQAMSSMQSAARAAAASISGPNNLINPANAALNVPNGLSTAGAGGLVPDSGLSATGVANQVTTWTNAQTPVQTSNADGTTTVTVTQTAQQALLNWNTFNIGKQTTLQFDQSLGGANVGEWIAFNTINDPSGRPSQILGSMQALGQVYVINQNGILFGGSSQTNLHTLVASSLPINTFLVNNGLLNNPDVQFLFSSLPQSAGNNGTPAFTPPAANTANGKPGDVVVEAGAILSSPTTAANVGGLNMLVGPNVTNNGTISNPDGQTILAAGDQVAIAAHSSSDPSLRGLDVYVGAVDASSGNVTNNGLIEAPRADVTMAGKSVNQLGMIDSSTSVSFNGRVDLLADYNAIGNLQYDATTAGSLPPFLVQNTGNVTLGPNSVTDILPELSSTDTVIGTELALPSQINMQGLSIYLGPGALVLAPNANVTASAGIQELAGGSSSTVYSAGQIYLDQNAIIDVGGSTDVAVPISQNLITVKLQGNELADSPLQLSGPLFGQTVTVDIRQTGTYDGTAWVGTPLANIAPYVVLIQRSVGELTTTGGTVTLDAGNSVVMQPGSTVNVSGGYIDYQGGVVQTTKVISNGVVYDISQATPDRVYSGVYDGSTVSSTKWGVTQTFSNPLIATSQYDAGYIQGANGGSISITAPGMALDGAFLGNTVAGPLQLRTQQNSSAMPTPASLSLTFLMQDPNSLFFYSPTPPSIVFEPGKSVTAADAFGLDASGNPLPLRSDRTQNVILSPDLVSVDGFGNLSIYDADGNLSVPAGVTLSAPFGAMTFNFANVEIEGSVIANGGSLNFTVYDFTPNLQSPPITQPPPTPPVDASRGNFTLGSAGVLSTAGLLVDDRPSSATALEVPLAIAGGTISINSFSADLKSGGVVNVSGGLGVSSGGKLTYGNGGSLSLKTGQDPNTTAIFGGTIGLGAELLGYSGATAGSLALQAQLIQIGPTAPPASGPGTLLSLTPDFFSQGGFGTFSLTGLGAAGGGADQYIPAIHILAGTVLAPAVESYVADFSSSTGAIMLTPTLLPAGQRTAATLAFVAAGVKDPNDLLSLAARGDFLMDAGAVIQTDVQTSSTRGVSISGDTATVLGTIIAPGGTISISGKNSPGLFVLNQAEPLVTVDIGPSSFLSVAGGTVLTPNSLGYRTGSVVPGGTISISGNIVAESGAVLDVSGASDVLDESPVYTQLNPASAGSPSSSVFVPTRVDSNAGTIIFKGSSELFTDATLIGDAGGPSANGGSLKISSGLFVTGNVTNPLDPNLLITQSGPVIPANFTTGIGQVVANQQGNPLAFLGHFAADSFESGGFDSLVLAGTVQFNGAVNIAANSSLSIASGGVIFANAPVTLSAPYVSLGQAFLAPVSPLSPLTNAFVDGNGSPYYFLPTNGPGALTVNAGLIDIGVLSLQNIGTANFVADNGDIRGDGVLDVAGNIFLQAGQIYPPTAVSFSIAAYDYKMGSTVTLGSVTIEQSGLRQLPLSAGGELSIYASDIVQGGTLRAPIGTINIGWNGTGSSPVDLITGAGVSGFGAVAATSVATASQVTLAANSVTSVSAIDPVTGETVIIPYGLNQDGNKWIDPTGIDITTVGPPGKTVVISGLNVSDESGSVIDTRGGGDLYAYYWEAGAGGSADILASTTSFAVLPGYAADYAPYAPFGNSSNFTYYNPTTGGNVTAPGYVNSKLTVGDQVYLAGSTALPAGTYTLLPARYALLPGAVLVTPLSSAPSGTSQQPDGSSIVSGYLFNDLNSAITGTPLLSAFEVAPGSVVRSRAGYQDSYANTFLASTGNGARLPIDSGQLLLEATQTLAVEGSVVAQAPAGGRGGLVDISSPVDILIASPGASASPGVLVLDSTELGNFGAESLLIGGSRATGLSGTTISVNTGSIEVDNAGAPLTGPDVILVANNTIQLDSGAQLNGAGSLERAADPLSVSGNGVLLRVSSDPSAAIFRANVTGSSGPSLTIGAGVQLTGGAIILDSSKASSIDPTATLSGQAISIDSGRISLVLDNAGALQVSPGLVLAGQALQGLQGAQALSFLSYSSIDVYGDGQVGSASLSSLTLSAADIRGFNNGGTVTFAAQDIVLNNAPGAASSATVISPPTGTLIIDAQEVQLGTNQINVDQVATVVMNAPTGLLATGTGGFATQGALTINAPLITGLAGAEQSISAGGSLVLQSPVGAAATVLGGLGASLTLQGADVVADTDIVVPSGQLTLHAVTGDMTIGGRLDVGGTVQTFFDLTQYTNGGEISLIADAGAVDVAAGGVVSVSANAGGGSAGSLTVSAPTSEFSIEGQLLGAAGAGGTSGSLALDVGRLPSGNVASISPALVGFEQARSIRDRLDSVVTLDGSRIVHSFSLSADSGSIDVTGSVDASGVTGGAISLQAFGSVVLEPTAMLTVAAQNFDDAGKGGSVDLEAGSEVNGVVNGSALLDLQQTGWTIDLSVAANNAASAGLGQFTGTLHLRAPQTAANSDVQITPINGTVLGASSIVVEGYELFDLTNAAGSTISSNVMNNVKSNGTTFGSNIGDINTVGSMTNRLLANNSSLASVLVVVPGAEVINRTGDLTLSSDWDLSTFRFGPENTPGVLTLKADGNLVFNGALSDGFRSSAYNATLLTQNLLLPTNTQSYSYRLVAGADFSGADFSEVQSLSSLGASAGSLELGVDGVGASSFGNNGTGALTSDAVKGHYQVIRTGTGDIDISTGRNVELLNQFATIFTAGVQVTNPTLGGTFSLPAIRAISSSQQGLLGATQENPPYPAQYSLAGGNVSITAQGNIEHLTLQGGQLVPDSEKQLPDNWLDRRGYVAANGQFGLSFFRDTASTTWWVDFSNFFEGVGALGGGNVTMTAAGDVSNVDAVIPTNARMPSGTPNAASLVELGGGDLIVRAGKDISGGVYYVERGTGTLTAGGQITTNSTRSPSVPQTLVSTSQPLPSDTWLPTTLYLGEGSFNVSAGGDVLLGPVVNAFLMPQSINNTFYYKTYFSSYGADDSVDVSSLGGSVTLREEVTLPGYQTPVATLVAWLQNVFLLSAGPPSVSYYEPWLRLDETNVNSIFNTVAALMPPALEISAFSGDANLVGSFALSPSPHGTLDIAVAGSINALQANGLTQYPGTQISVTTWDSATVNLSDANPDSVPGVASPLAYQAVAGTTSANTLRISSSLALQSVNALFAESGSTTGQQSLLQTRQTLHSPGPLHAGDPNPALLYAENGDISGLTLFSAKAARVIAGEDITDIALYIQNASASDFSVVAAGGNITPYDPSSPLQQEANQSGNTTNSALNNYNTSPYRAGDIQISGPGTLEVLAGKNLDLGLGASNADGTGVGISSIGNARNPYLPFAGAGVVVGAGIGVASGLAESRLDFPAFISDFLSPSTAGAYASRFLPDLGTLLGLTNAGDTQIWTAFSQLTPEQQDSLALEIFYLVLRDAGRDHNDPESAGYGNYDAGFAAIAALFPSGSGAGWQGDIALSSRNIETLSGGNISVFAPGGGLSLGTTILSPPPGIVTEDGGTVSIFTKDSVDVGVERIFTLRSGNIAIWSSHGDIAAGASAKTVKSAPPTRVLIDPQSANVQTDLAGLATGGGIGVLATVAGVAPGDVDLIAPNGSVNAGEAGIRSSGNLNIAAVQVLNAGNIQAGGASVGTPTVSTPNVGGLTAATTTAGASNAAGSEQAAAQNKGQQGQQQDLPSIITVEVIGYGGGSSPDDDEKRRKKEQGGVGRASEPEHEQKPQLITANSAEVFTGSHDTRLRF